MSDQPKFLLLETSQRVGWVGLACGGQLLARQAMPETRAQARDLAPHTQALLQAQGWLPRDLSAIFVSLGPGSYTGLRVGLMSAKALAYVIGAKLIAVETFALLAHQAPADILQLDVLTDAQQTKVYWQRYTRTQTGAPLRPTTELVIEPLASWLAARPTETFVTGPGVTQYRAQLPADLPVLADALREPTLSALLELGLARYERGEFTDLFACEPIYLRPSSAEEQWLALGRK